MQGVGNLAYIHTQAQRHTPFCIFDKCQLSLSPSLAVVQYVIPCYCIVEFLH